MCETGDRNLCDAELLTFAAGKTGISDKAFVLLPAEDKVELDLTATELVSLTRNCGVNPVWLNRTNKTTESPKDIMTQTPHFEFVFDPFFMS